MKKHGISILLVGIFVCFSLGCFGPRVTVITSTTVGLEAKPPMGDGQPNPSVSFGYKRAEMALVPVCEVPDYTWWKSIKENFGHKDEAKSKTQCPPNSSEGHDAHAVLGSFQMAHNWFGPLNVRQFIATGMAATNLMPSSIHVSGAVKKPGRKLYQDGLTIEKALELAGGYTDLEKKGKITATQTDKSGKAGETRELGEKAAVLPGDIIVVEPKAAPKDQSQDSQENPGTASEGK